MPARFGCVYVYYITRYIHERYPRIYLYIIMLYCTQETNEGALKHFTEVA